jgi:hypothetical protein
MMATVWGDGGCTSSNNSTLTNLDAGVCNPNQTFVSTNVSTLVVGSGQCNFAGSATPIGSVTALAPVLNVCCAQ